MKTIKYRLASGKTITLKVKNIIADELVSQDKYEKSVELRETRRHISLDLLAADKTPALEEEILLEESPLPDPSPAYENILTAKERKIMDMLYVRGMTRSMISKKLKISKSAVTKRMRLIVSKILGFLHFENPEG